MWFCRHIGLGQGVPQRVATEWWLMMSDEGKLSCRAQNWVEKCLISAASHLSFDYLFTRSQQPPPGVDDWRVAGKRIRRKGFVRSWKQHFKAKKLAFQRFFFHPSLKETFDIKKASIGKYPREAIYPHSYRQFIVFLSIWPAFNSTSLVIWSFRCRRKSRCTMR